MRPGGAAGTIDGSSREPRHTGYGWKGERIVFVKDFGGDENFHVVSVDLKGGDLKDLTPGEKVKANLVDILYDDDEHLLISHNRRDARVFDVFRVDVKSGEEKLVAQNPGNVTGWKTDHDAKVRAATVSDGVNSQLLYREREEDAFKAILTTNFREAVAPLFFTFDHRKLHEHPEVDVTSMFYSRKRKVPTVITWTTWKTERRFLDKPSERYFRDVESKLPGDEVAFTSTNRAEDKFIVAAYSDKTRGKRYLYDVATKKLDLIADVSPWLPESELADMKPVRYTARDGLAIHGYLTRCRGAWSRRTCRSS